MAFKASLLLVLCAQALLFKISSCQYANPRIVTGNNIVTNEYISGNTLVNEQNSANMVHNYGPAGVINNGVAGTGIAGTGIAGTAIAGNSIAFTDGYTGIGGTPFLNGYNYDGGFYPGNAGTFTVTSGSPITPTGVTAFAENLVLEGAVNVAGKMPFIGAVALDGSVPTGGYAAVAFGTDRGSFGMLREAGANGLAGAELTGLYANGLAANNLAANELAGAALVANERDNYANGIAAGIAARNAYGTIQY